MSRRAKSKPTPDHEILKILTIGFSPETQLKPREISRPIDNQPDRTHRQFHSHSPRHITRCMQTTWPFKLLKLYPLKQDTKVRNRSPLNSSSPSRDWGDRDWFRPWTMLAQHGISDSGTQHSVHSRDGYIVHVSFGHELAILRRFIWR